MADESRKWTETEDQVLRATVRKTTHLPERSNKDCRRRWRQKFAENTNFGSWIDSEDDRLRAAVALHGTKWPVISKEVGTRTSEQYSKRWKHVLDPNLNHSPWTQDEDGFLLASVEQHGRNWKMISEMYFKNRAALSLKNRHSLLLRRRKKSNALSQGFSKFQPESQPSTINVVPNSFRSRQRLENSATCAENPGPSEKEIQDESMFGTIDENGFENETGQYDWGDREAATSDEMFDREYLFPNANFPLSSSSFQGQVLEEDLGIDDILEGPSWGAQNVSPLAQYNMPNSKGNFEGLLDFMPRTESFSLYPPASLDHQRPVQAPSAAPAVFI
ncbi:uncharacterized protein ATNIH1004_009294 [Aspergillus tanneri]|uniref:Uncharacterized protein n=1 Tax=Aspergillus tanneri TaxID=1220188 RepID=A0A5M9MDN4_9EURO|nr:uncharacterized protein ATNIH1004_009294 [Aspergillus tanneri]KAA8645082.1 hypothetical protein ATNIH1004_009294 [Aspergillus tanneri]